LCPPLAAMLFKFLMPKYLRQFAWGTAAGGMAVLKMQTGA